jgi:hypothetical protein
MRFSISENYNLKYFILREEPKTALQEGSIEV